MQFGWTADEPTSFAVMSKAVEMGINFVDTADIYSRWAAGNEGGESETIIGNWLASGAADRHSLAIATKVRGQMGLGPNDEGLSRVHILYAVEQSLKRLQTDYIDLYQVHFPDKETPLDETLAALESLISSGKVRYIGCSNYPAWLLAKSLWISDLRQISRFDSLQPHYSYVHRAEFERELQPLCLDQAIGVIPYSPLGGGFLTGKYRRDGDLPDSTRATGVKNRYMNAKGFEAVEKLEAFGQEHGATIAQTAVAWVLANPAVSSAIIGANSVAQLEDNVKGAEVTITPEEKEALDEVTAWS
jgi:aryl-alcohol dehydrogenase-like predicted oxidoreductase